MTRVAPGEQSDSRSKPSTPRRAGRFERNSCVVMSIAGKSVGGVLLKNRAVDLRWQPGELVGVRSAMAA